MSGNEPSMPRYVALARGFLLAGFALQIALGHLVAVPLRRRERWAGWAIAIATANWFAIDTTLSAAHGVWINVAFNVGALAMIAIPLAIMLPWLKRASVQTSLSMTSMASSS